MVSIFVRERTLNKNQWRQTPKTAIDLTLDRTRMITKISSVKKETVRLLIAPTGWICLELLNLLLNLVQTGMKYPDLMTIWKGAMITTKKVSHIAWKSKTFIIFLDLYYSYKNFNGDVPIINVDDMLCETIKYVNKEHIGAFYRTAYRTFVTTLKEVKLKDLYSHEINFKGKVGDTDQIYRILPLPPRGGNERPIKNFRNAVFVTMFFSHNCFRYRCQKGFSRIRWSTWFIWRQM